MHAVTVEVASGAVVVIADQRATTVDEAFTRLRKYAREHYARIHDVSRAVVKGDLLLWNPPPSAFATTETGS